MDQLSVSGCQAHRTQRVNEGQLSVIGLIEFLNVRSNKFKTYSQTQPKLQIFENVSENTILSELQKHCILSK